MSPPINLGSSGPYLVSYAPARASPASMPGPPTNTPVQSSEGGSSTKMARHFHPSSLVPSASALPHTDFDRGERTTLVAESAGRRPVIKALSSARREDRGKVPSSAGSRQSNPAVEPGQGLFPTAGLPAKPLSPMPAEAEGLKATGSLQNRGRFPPPLPPPPFAAGMQATNSRSWTQFDTEAPGVGGSSSSLRQLPAAQHLRIQQNGSLMADAGIPRAIGANLEYAPQERSLGTGSSALVASSFPSDPRAVPTDRSYRSRLVILRLAEIGLEDDGERSSR